MINTIEKRDGRVVQFNPEKIYNAIMKSIGDTKPAIDISSDDNLVAKQIANEVIIKCSMSINTIDI